MVFSCVTRTVFSILPLLVILSIPPLSSSFCPCDKVTETLVLQLCAQPTIYSHFCNAWLNSDPKTFTVDLHGLIGMVFQKAEGLSFKNLEMIKGVSRINTDPRIKIPYEYCLTEYELAIKVLGKAKVFARSKDYLSATKEAYAAFDSIDTCQDILKGLQPPNVYSRNEMLKRMVNIARVFTVLLTY